MALRNGTNGNNRLKGTRGDDTLYGLGGDDTLYGKNGNDTLDGGTGSDRLDGGAGNDLYIVDSSDDIVIEVANAGFDGVQSSVTWVLGANLENLTLTGNSAINGTGNALNNFITGNAGNNSLFGGDGNDRLIGGSGNDTLSGGAGNDTYMIYADDTNDVINEDVNGGTDTIFSSISRSLAGALNVENLVLNAGTTGIGNNLNNTITGNGGFNILSGGGGNDTLIGGDDNDNLVGGAGNDSLIGGNGMDSFYFYSQTEGVDTITQFSVGNDTIDVSAAGFGGGLTAGAAITTDQFRTGARAGDAGDRFIYNSTTGALFFDADGIGGTAQVQIATLSPQLVMTNTDIFVFA